MQTQAREFRKRGGLEEMRTGDEPPAREDYPVLLRPESIRKWILVYEQTLRQRVLYPPLGTQITWRQVVLEQARRLARHIKAEEIYEPFVPR